MSQRRIPRFLIVIIVLGSVFVVSMVTHSNIYRSLQFPRQDPFLGNSLYIGLAVIALILVFILGLSIEILAKRGMKRARHNGQSLAKSLWTVSEIPQMDNNVVVVKLANYTWTDRFYLLTVRSGHPDIQRFKDLNEGDVVEFTFLEKVGTWALPSETSAYVRLASVTTAP